MSNELAMMNGEETLQSVMHALQRTVDLPNEQKRGFGTDNCAAGAKS